MYETWSVSCYRLVTTVRAWQYIPKVWTMLRHFLSSSDNGQSMVIYPLGMNHAPSVVFVSWQRSEHGNLYLRYDPNSVSCYRLVTTVRAWLYILWYEPCSVSCYRLMTTVRAWLYILKVWTVLRQMLSFSDNGHSMVIYPLGMNHAPSVVIVSWPRSEHGNISLRYEPCSVSCYHLVTTVREW